MMSIFVGSSAIARVKSEIAFVVGLVQVGAGTFAISLGEFWIDRDRRIQVLDGAVIVANPHIGACAVAEEDPVRLWADGDCLSVAGDGFNVVAQAEVRVATAIVGPNVLGSISIALSKSAMARW